MRPINRYDTHILVVGNEKGGTGKSTTAMHLIVSIQRQGKSVAVVDLDARQRSVTRYLENRAAFAERRGLGWGLPEHAVVDPSTRQDARERDQEDEERLHGVLARLAAGHDFIVIDCPGGHTHLAHLAHAVANTLLTPLNDSFLDLDLLAQVDPDTYAVSGLSFYAEAVWESRKLRAGSGLPGLDWVVLRNRIPPTHSKNRERMDQALKSLQKRLAFRYVRGLSERVIYRELFPKGLTLADLKDIDEGPKLTMSHVAARHELRSLMNDLALPGWSD
ncbi:MAG: division plane positioning ATPase MipZ [Bdellovibrio bacteriovorus]